MTSANQASVHGAQGALEVHHEAEHAHSGRFYLVTWLWLLIITVVEVGIVAMKPDRALLVPALLGLTAMKAAIIIANFMHVRFEWRTLLYYVVLPPFILGLAAFLGMFPDFSLLKWIGG